MRLTSTLDARFQRIATTSLARQLHGLAGRARDGAVIVVDNATGDVLAYVGGAGTASTAPAVDAADSYRQAGSSLKPFLYADAIEKGYLTAASILDDSPVQLEIGRAHSELQSLMRLSYDVFCLKQTKKQHT